MFLPPNCTSELQPLDLGIIQAFKVKYVQLMMTHMVSKIDEVDTAAEVCRSINVLQAIRWIAQAWQAVQSSTIVKCFAKAGVLDATGDVVEGQASPHDQDPFGDLDEDVSSTDSLLQESCGPETISVQDFIACESSLPPYRELEQNWEDKFLASLTVGSASDDNEESDDNDVEELSLSDETKPEPNIKSFGQAMNQLEEISVFLTESASASQLADELLKIISSLQSLSVERSRANLVQKSIKEFFKSQQ